MDRATRLTALGLAPLALSACAGSQGDYPSLAIRNVERAQGQFEPVAPQQLDVPPVATNVSAEPAAILAQARAAHARFEQALGPARARVSAGRGAAAGSNAWGAAQVALADLESIRSDTAIALADLDALHVAASVQYADRPALDAARSAVTGLVAQEDAALAELRSAFQ